MRLAVLLVLVGCGGVEVTEELDSSLKTAAIVKTCPAAGDSLDAVEEQLGAADFACWTLKAELLSWNEGAVSEVVRWHVGHYRRWDSAECGVLQGRSLCAWVQPGGVVSVDEGCAAAAPEACYPYR